MKVFSCLGLELIFVVGGLLPWIIALLPAGLCVSRLTATAQEEGIDSMSGRNLTKKTGNDEEPVRKKLRMQPSSSTSSSSSKFQFPKTLEEFKYKFNEKGELRHVTSGERYVFEVERGNQAYNQKRYEALGKVVTQHIYTLLEAEGLDRVYVPVSTDEDEPRSFVFASPNAATTTDRLLVLINGAGAVRAGQWARRLIINDCLDSGTQLPYIRRALREGYEVLVLNTNENRGLNSRGDSLPVKGNSSPYEHGVYVWDNFIANKPVRQVAIVAHSMGGGVTAHIAQKRETSFLRKTFAIAFTDSIHNLAFTKVSMNVRKFFAKHSVNWVSSPKPLDTPIMSQSSPALDSKRVSAGTKVHAETSWTSFQSVFTFLKDKESELAARLAGKPGVSLAEDDEEYSDDETDDDDDIDEFDDEATEEYLQQYDNGRNSIQAKDSSQKVLSKVSTVKSAGIDISSSDEEEDTEASFDFTRHGDEL
ncbi:cotranscriptional regulator ARB2A homolog [Diadema antillarum]|uniref:cotranscriptional regulator ARB2A homolog n=1 Tax=Diadema antillarum TaxID=105358 RepID=UPI003A897206